MVKLFVFLFKRELKIWKLYFGLKKRRDQRQLLKTVLAIIFLTPVPLVVYHYSVSIKGPIRLVWELQVFLWPESKAHTSARSCPADYSQKTYETLQTALQSPWGLLGNWVIVGCFRLWSLWTSTWARQHISPDGKHDRIFWDSDPSNGPVIGQILTLCHRVITQGFQSTQLYISVGRLRTRLVVTSKDYKSIFWKLSMESSDAGLSSHITWHTSSELSHIRASQAKPSGSPRRRGSDFIAT